MSLFGYFLFGKQAPRIRTIQSYTPGIQSFMDNGILRNYRVGTWRALFFPCKMNHIINVSVIFPQSFRYNTSHLRVLTHHQDHENLQK